MNLNIAEALRTLHPDEFFLLANEARPPRDYLFNTILPEELRFDYQARAGSMTVRSTMAGLVGMDSVYPPGGHVAIEEFSEETAKIANRVELGEKALRDLYQFTLEAALGGGDTKERIVETALNFGNKIIVQPHLDTMEFLRGMALSTGVIDWTFGKIRLYVDYGVPAGNRRAQRTGSDAYHGTTSKFWEDVQFIRRKLKNNVLAIIAHGDTIDAARYNPANAMAVVSEGEGFVEFRKYNPANGQFTADSGDRVVMVRYDKEADILNPNDTSQVINLPFMPRGILLGVAKNTGTDFTIGSGSTIPNELALGYTHLAPTNEGDFKRGRWSNVGVPPARKWALYGEGVTNGLPVIRNPEKIATTSTEMPVLI